MLFRSSMWLAGGGVKGGTIVGKTDPIGYTIVERPVGPPDLHATVLHLMGINGRDLEVPGRKRLEIDHGRPISEELKAAGFQWAEHIFSISHTDRHFEELARSVAPQGRICVIDDPQLIDVRLLKARCASLHWEAMFTRSGFQTSDMAEQGRLLGEVARLVDEGTVRSTHTQTLGPISAAALRAAHEQLETGRTIGKITLAGF